MRYLITIILGICMTWSCGSKKNEIDILSEDEMVAIMVDIHLAEGMASSLPIPYDSSKKLYPVFERDVFLKHDISDSVYLKSLQYYLRNTAKMEQLYARTIDSLLILEKTRE